MCNNVSNVSTAMIPRLVWTAMDLSGNYVTTNTVFNLGKVYLVFSRTHNKIYKRKIDVIVLVKLNLLLSIVLSPPIRLIRGLLKLLMRNVGWRK